MRILFLSSFVPDPAASFGGPVVMAGHLEGLRRGNDLTVVALTNGSHAEAAAADAHRAGGIEVHTVVRPQRDGARGLARRGRLAARWLTGNRPLRAEAFRLSAVQQLINELCRTRQFDAVHVEDNAMADYATPGGVPHVLVEHEVRAAEEPIARTGLLGGNALRLDERARWCAYQRRVWRRFDRIQVFTSRDAAVIARLAPDLADRVRVNPFGVALPELPEPAAEPSDTILFVGDFRHPPNVDAAAWLAHRIFPAVLDRQPSARLCLVGGHPPRSLLGIASDRIEVTGYVPSVLPYLARAAVVAAPLRTGGGMRFKVLEAMAAGRPIVATSLAAEGVQEAAASGAIVLADGAAPIASAIVDLLSDDARRRRLGESARGWVAHHRTRAVSADRLRALYDGLLSEREAGHGLERAAR